MKDKIEKILILLMFCFCFITGQAQEVITTSGGNASGNTGSLSYTLGQIAYTTLSSTTGILTQGVQQPYEIFITKSTPNTEGINLLVYPNPTRDILTLKIINMDIKGLRYILYDMNGKLLQDKLIESNEIPISLGAYAGGVYVLKVTDLKKKIKIFKIIKN
jgi:hypothetical protein